jgi:DNA sulfur modification protein DndD
MFINNITLEDFRIYQGVQELKFSKSGKKNVYIISGNNGFGKTTLLNSLVWCLYGKLMVDVDDKFRRDIYEAGGYKKFATNNLNKVAKANCKLRYSVSLTLSDIHITSLPCKNVKVMRAFNLDKGEDELTILIDGMENELTREVGQEIFINDFILPKEVAKFFFFDAEKIVSLAEMKSIDDKRNLSKAYSEVLGIKKYEDLKTNLEDMRIRFRRNSASEKDKEKFKELQKEIARFRKLIHENENQIKDLVEEKNLKKNASEQYQEKLIREGNAMTVQQLNELKKLKTKISSDADVLKTKLKELLDLAPFAIAGSKLSDTRNQVLSELENSQQGINPELMKKKLSKIQKEFLEASKKLRLSPATSKKLASSVKDTILRYFDSRTDSKNCKVLLGFSDAEQNELEAIYNNLKYSFSEAFKKLIEEYKNNRIAFKKVVRKLSNAESKENDLLIQKIREQKNSLDKRIEEIDKKVIELSQEIGGLQREIAIKSKVASELVKKIDLELSDQVKDEAAQRLIIELDEFIRELKLDKKGSLENKIGKELNALMHKRNFISKVELEIAGDIIDIQLYDSKGNYVDKETLSKGEQQLYATALLKSLVDESNIGFPVFIDSPLQKFDKKHSKNIICEFYPKISDQVVLFPLLEKELTELEFTTLLPKVNKVYLINNVEEYASEFLEIEPDKLFVQSKKLYEDVYAH